MLENSARRLVGAATVTPLDFGAQALNVLNHAQHVPGSLNQINSIGYTSTEVTNALQAGTPTFGDFNSVFSNQPRSLGLSLKFIF